MPEAPAPTPPGPPLARGGKDRPPPRRLPIERNKAEMNLITRQAQGFTAPGLGQSLAPISAACFQPAVNSGGTAL
jgi:hypothetical protein